MCQITEIAALQIILLKYRVHQKRLLLIFLQYNVRVIVKAAPK